MINNTRSKVIYVISDRIPIQSGYMITFPYFDESNIKVIITDGKTEVTVDPSNYTVVTVGTVPYLRFVSGYTFPEEVTKIVISREMEIFQETDLANGEIIDAEQLERVFDMIVAICQQLDEKLSRTLMTTSAESSPIIIPESDQRAGHLLGFDDSGKITLALTIDIQQKLNEAYLNIQEYVENTSHPELDAYVSGTSKPSLDTYVENTSKPAINAHVATKKTELDDYESLKETHLNSYTAEKKAELDSYVTDVKKPELDAYELEKENEIQAKVDSFTDYSDTQNRLNELKGDLTYSQLIKNVDFTIKTNGGFVNNSGQFITDSSFDSIDINISKNETVFLRASGYLDSVAMISVKKNNTYTPILNSIGSVVADYNYTATEDCTVTLSFRIASDHNAYITYPVAYNDMVLYDLINSLNNNIYKEENVDFSNELDGFVNNEGQLVYSGAFKHLSPFNVSNGSKIIFNGRGYLDSVAMISVYQNGNYIPKEISIDSTVREYSYTANEDCQIVLSYNSSHTHNAKIISAKFLTEKILDEELENMKLTDIKSNLFSIFETFGACGDSLISGVIEVASGNMNEAVTNYNLSWAKQIANICGNNYTHYSYGGLTSKSWLENFRETVTSKDAYFVALGTNDYATMVLGTNADVGTNEDTFYRYYGEIIALLKSKNPNSKIFVCSIYRNEDERVNWNNAIKYFADNNSNVYYLDFTNMTNDYGMYKNGSHFSAIGYKMIANKVSKMLDKIIIDNWSDFRYVGTYD